MEGGCAWWFPWAISALATVLVGRVIFLTCRGCGKEASRGRRGVRTLIVLGSGGHTAEMLSLLTHLLLNRNFSPRFYVAASTDTMSLEKAKLLENSVSGSSKVGYLEIYRSREVGQSYVTSVGTTLISLAHAFWLMLIVRPQVILCNGPGTCIPLCSIAFLFKVLWIGECSIFYVESIARVKKLSLSGLILYKLRIADVFFVQWPHLQTLYPRAHYVGRLM